MMAPSSVIILDSDEEAESSNKRKKRPDHDSTTIKKQKLSHSHTSAGKKPLRVALDSRLLLASKTESPKQEEEPKLPRPINPTFNLPINTQGDFNASFAFPLDKTSEILDGTLKKFLDSSVLQDQSFLKMIDKMSPEVFLNSTTMLGDGNFTLSQLEVSQLLNSSLLDQTFSTLGDKFNVFNPEMSTTSCHQKMQSTMRNPKEFIGNVGISETVAANHEPSYSFPIHQEATQPMPTSSNLINQMPYAPSFLAPPFYPQFPTNQQLATAALANQMLSSHLLGNLNLLTQLHLQSFLANSMNATAANHGFGFNGFHGNESMPAEADVVSIVPIDEGLTEVEEDVSVNHDGVLAGVVSIAPVEDVGDVDVGSSVEDVCMKDGFADDTSGNVVADHEIVANVDDESLSNELEGNDENLSEVPREDEVVVDEVVTNKVVVDDVVTDDGLVDEEVIQDQEDEVVDDSVKHDSVLGNINDDIVEPVISLSAMEPVASLSQSLTSAIEPLTPQEESISDVDHVHSNIDDDLEVGSYDNDISDGVDDFEVGGCNDDICESVDDDDVISSDEGYDKNNVACDNSSIDPGVDDDINNTDNVDGCDVGEKGQDGGDNDDGGGGGDDDCMQTIGESNAPNDQHTGMIEDSNPDDSPTESSGDLSLQHVVGPTIIEHENESINNNHPSNCEFPSIHDREVSLSSSEKIHEEILADQIQSTNSSEAVSKQPTNRIKVSLNLIGLCKDVVSSTPKLNPDTIKKETSDDDLEQDDLDQDGQLDIKTDSPNEIKSEIKPFETYKNDIKRESDDYPSFERDEKSSEVGKDEEEKICSDPDLAIDSNGTEHDRNATNDAITATDNDTNDVITDNDNDTNDVITATDDDTNDDPATSDKTERQMPVSRRISIPLSMIQDLDISTFASNSVQERSNYVPCYNCKQEVAQFAKCTSAHTCCVVCLFEQIKMWLASNSKDVFACEHPNCTSFYKTVELRQVLPEMLVDVMEEKLEMEYVVSTNTLLRKVNSKLTPVAPIKLETDDFWPPYDHWGKMEDGKSYSLIDIDSSTKEFEKISKLFHKTMTSDRAKVIKVRKVLNPSLWQYYSMMKDQRMRRLSHLKQQLERMLFHGLKKDFLDNVCADNVDWRRCGISHGILFGEGTYFARDASYANQFTDKRPPSFTPSVKSDIDEALDDRLIKEKENSECDPMTYDSVKKLMSQHLRSILEDRGQTAPKESPPHSRFMLVARVFVGRYTVGRVKMRKPPPIDASDPFGVCYDSLVNYADRPTLFVISDLNQSYPEYVIEYTNKPKKKVASNDATENSFWFD